jgi:hypothetical protein
MKIYTKLYSKILRGRGPLDDAGVLRRIKLEILKKWNVVVRNGFGYLRRVLWRILVNSITNL